MFRLFYKYLILNKKATVQGIGTFYFERKPAKLDFADKVFHAPALQVAFTLENVNADSGLQTFIASQQNISEEKAAEHYNAFTKKLQENLDKHKTAELPGIGLLSKNVAGELSFTATKVITDYFSDVAAQRILREHVEHTVSTGDLRRTNVQMKEKPVEEVHGFTRSNDNWWIFAIALGIIGVATIVYYYMHNGKLH